MSEVTLTIFDSNRAIHGHIHGSDANRAIAALAAEPETIEELDLAMCRFSDRDEPCHFAWFRSGDSEEPWDAGVVIIDLAARIMAGESTYSAISKSSSVYVRSCKRGVDYRLPDDWKVMTLEEAWRSVARERRQERQRQPRIDARAVLFGSPMLEFVVEHVIAEHGLEAEEAARKVHADWLTTVRDDLGGRAPRDVLLAKKDFLDWDSQYRESQWSDSGKCPPGIGRDTAAYKYAGFGTNEIVMYYELVRHLICECRERLERETELNRADEMRRLEKLRAAWMETPCRDFHGRTPASLIDNERRRIPEASTGAEAMIDPDCPCCQMMADDMGPYFWHLDGCNMDDDFAFSFHQTREEWEAEQREWEDFNRKFDEDQARRELDRDAATRIWSNSFVEEKFQDDMPLSQFVPVAAFGFAAMIAEINQDILKQSSDKAAARAEQETLNRLVGNLRAALSNSAELIDPTLDRLQEELGGVAEQYPEVGEKCGDLSRRLREFPARLVAAAKRGDMPF